MLRRTRRIVVALALAAAFAAIGSCAGRPPADARLRVALSFPVPSSSAPLDGRMLLLMSTDGSQKPRFQIGDNDRTQHVFGVNVDGLQPRQESVTDSSVLGYPVASDTRSWRY